MFVIAGFPDVVFEDTFVSFSFSLTSAGSLFASKELGFTNPQPGEMFIKSRLNEVSGLSTCSGNFIC